MNQLNQLKPEKAFPAESVCLMNAALGAHCVEFASSSVVHLKTIFEPFRVFRSLCLLSSEPYESVELFESFESLESFESPVATPAKDNSLLLLLQFSG